MALEVVQLPDFVIVDIPVVPWRRGATAERALSRLNDCFALDVTRPRPCHMRGQRCNSADKEP